MISSVMNYVRGERRARYGNGRSSVLAKALQVGGATLASRMLGLLREMLMVKFLGAGALSDAFFTAFKIPNSMRKIFAEGALSASFIPTFVKLGREGKAEQISKLMSLAFLFIQGALLLICLAIFARADLVIQYISPGWYELVTQADGSTLWVAQAQVLPAITYTRLLIFFILFLSASSLLAGALQAKEHFFVPAISPVLLNVVFIGGIAACLYYKLSVEYLCSAILSGGLLQLLLHIAMYRHLGFGFSLPNAETWHAFGAVLLKFVPCLLTMSIMEVNLFMSTTLASYLPHGSISLIYYANRFMGIPLGVFATALSTILLPFFSRITTYAPRRLGVYLYESSKLILWVTVSMTIAMSVLSYQLFLTLFHSARFSLGHVQQASILLIIFLCGLFVFSLNKILLNIFYAFHDTRTPTFVALGTIFTNYVICRLLLPWFGVFGLAAGMVIVSYLQAVVYTLLLHYKYNVDLYFKRFMQESIAIGLQAAVIMGSFIAVYKTLYILLHMLGSTVTAYGIASIGFWLWCLPLIISACYALYATRRWFGIRMHFLP